MNEQSGAFRFDSMKPEPISKPSPINNEEGFDQFVMATDIQEYFDTLGFTVKGTILPENTCMTILTRARELVRTDEQLTVDEAMKVAYIERAAIDGSLGLSMQSESLKAALRDYITYSLGRDLTEDEWTKLMQELQVEHPGEALLAAIQKIEGAQAEGSDTVVTVNTADGSVAAVNWVGNEIQQQRAALDEREGFPKRG